MTSSIIIFRDTRKNFSLLRHTFNTLWWHTFLLCVLGLVDYAMGSWVILFRAVMIVRIVLTRIFIARSFQPIREYRSFLLSFRRKSTRLRLDRWSWLLCDFCDISRTTVPTTLLTRNALVTYRLTFHRYLSCNRGDIKCSVFRDVRIREREFFDVCDFHCDLSSGVKLKCNIRSRSISSY